MAEHPKFLGPATVAFKLYLNDSRCQRLGLPYAAKVKPGVMHVLLVDFIAVMYELDEGTYQHAAQSVADGIINRHRGIVFEYTLLDDVTFPGHFTAHTVLHAPSDEGVVASE
jgi:hypothetical protein